MSAMKTTSTPTYDYFAKILMIGNSGVGKTNILLRYCDADFKINHMSTIGIDFKIKIVQVDNKKIRLQIWDTAGQQKFKTVTQSYFKGCKGIFVVYSIDDRESFNAVERWIEQAKTHANENLTMILIGNKEDVDKSTPLNRSCSSTSGRQVSKQQGQKLAQKYKMDFFEVSAMTGNNITEMFLEMSKEIKEIIFDSRKEQEGGEGAPKIRNKSRIELDSKGRPKKIKQKCC